MLLLCGLHRLLLCRELLRLSHLRLLLVQCCLRVTVRRATGLLAARLRLPRRMPLGLTTNRSAVRRLHIRLQVQQPVSWRGSEGG